MNPAPKSVDETKYSGRFAARLRMLREKAGLTVEELAGLVTTDGYKITAKTIYNWEAALRQPPVDAYPLLAKALSLKTVRSILPEE